MLYNITDYMSDNTISCHYNSFQKHCKSVIKNQSASYIMGLLRGFKAKLRLKTKNNTTETTGVVCLRYQINPDLYEAPRKFR